MTFHISVSVIRPFMPFILKSGPAPSRRTRKISPSVDPRSHLASVRSDGCVSFGAIGPLPLASAPWQKRQFFVNAAWPAAIESADEGTGFFIFLPSSLPPGFWALTAVIATRATPRPTTTDEKIRRIFRKSPLFLIKGGAL